MVQSFLFEHVVIFYLPVSPQETLFLLQQVEVEGIKGHLQKRPPEEGQGCKALGMHPCTHYQKIPIVLPKT